MHFMSRPSRLRGCTMRGRQGAAGTPISSKPYGGGECALMRHKDWKPAAHDRPVPLPKLAFERILGGRYTARVSGDNGYMVYPPQPWIHPDTIVRYNRRARRARTTKTGKYYLLTFLHMKHVAQFSMAPENPNPDRARRAAHLPIAELPAHFSSSAMRRCMCSCACKTQGGVRT